MLKIMHNRLIPKHNDIVTLYVLELSRIKKLV